MANSARPIHPLRRLKSPPPYSLCTYPVQQGLGHPFQGSWYRSSWFLGNCEVRWRCLPCTLCNFIFILQNQRNQSLLHLRTQDDRTIPPDLVLTNAFFQYNNPVYRALVYQLKHGFMKHWLYISNPKYITNGYRPSASLEAGLRKELIPIRAHGKTLQQKLNMSNSLVQKVVLASILNVSLTDHCSGWIFNSTV